MEKINASKANRLRQRRAVRAKAPLAAQFEDCLQSFDRLGAAINADTQTLSHEHVLVDDCYAKIKAWGIDSGASTRALDHRLRRASQLAVTISELLVDLHAILEEANEVNNPQLERPTDQSLDGDDKESTSTEDIGLNDDRVPVNDVEKSLEDVMDVIDCLIGLLPTLRDPVPEDFYEKSESVQDATEDIKLAMFLFPNAPLLLKERLGKANWRRRQDLKEARKRSSLLGSASKGVLGNKMLDAAPRKAPESRRNKMNNRYHRAASRTTSEGGMSILSSIFSRRQFDIHSVTTAAESEGPSQLTGLTPPEPPVSLVFGTCFTCPFCRLEIVVGDEVTTEADWSQHVYLDLEPYICTFDCCFRADKVFGIREDWFKHELYNHRVPKVWVCRIPICQNIEFAKKELFEQHLQSTHPDFFSSSQLPMLINNCERFSEQPLLSQICVLCGISCSDAPTLEVHLGYHLEQFALVVIQEEDSSDEAEGSDEDEDAAMHESRSNFLIHEFFDDQVDFLPPNMWKGASAKPQLSDSVQLSIRGKRVSVGPFGSNSSDTSDLHDQAGNAIAKKPKEDLWEVKVEAFLGRQNEVQKAKEETPTTPTIWTNMPMRNLSFVGRTNDLDAIRTSFTSTGQIHVLRGSGGIGKTSTIVEYAYLHERDYSYIFWVEAETPAGLAETYSLIASTLKLGGDIIHDQHGLTILAREFLQRTEKKWLLIFDNTENWSDIAQFIPRNLSKTAGSVLITTRKENLLRPARNYHPHEIEAFTLDESRQLLLCSIQPNLSQHKLHKHPEYDLAGTASKLVDRLPLAISMIAGYVQVSRCSLSDFLEIWEEKQQSRKQTGASLENETSPDLAIDTLWDIGIRELPVAARNLLDLLVFLDAESIPHDLLVGDHKEPFLDFLNSSEKRRYKKMIDELSDRRLIAVKGQGTKQTLSIHRLLQEKIFQDLEQDKFSEVFGKAYCLVRKQFPSASPIQVPEPEKWQGCKEYTPHVLSLRRAFNGSTAIEPSLELAELFYDAGFHVWERGTNPHEGVLYLETAELVLDRLNHDSNAKIRADIHTIMALHFNRIGISHRIQCLQRLRDALSIREKVYELDPSNPVSDVLRTNAASDLGYCLFETWAVDEADQMFQVCYKRYCQWGAEDDFPFEYYKHYENNGRLCMHQGKYPEAIALFQRGLQLSERALGKTWKYWLLQFHLACTMLQAGDLDGALELHLEVFSAHEKFVGKYDDATILSNYAVGAVYHLLGNLPAAAKNFEECITIAVTSQPEEALARSRYHLARVYKEQGVKSAEAAVLEEEGLKVLEKYAGSTNECLRDVDDKLMLFDDLQPAVGGRFTSRALLAHMQKYMSGSGVSRAVN